MEEFLYEPIGEPTMRISRKNADGSVTSFSVRADISPEDLDKAFKAADNASAQVAAFKQLPEVEQLKYYLAHAYSELKKICDMAGIDLKDNPDWSDPMIKKYTQALCGIGATADMACLTIPSKYKTTNIEI